MRLLRRRVHASCRRSDAAVYDLRPDTERKSGTESRGAQYHWLAGGWLENGWRVSDQAGPKAIGSALFEPIRYEVTSAAEQG